MEERRDVDPLHFSTCGPMGTFSASADLVLLDGGATSGAGSARKLQRTPERIAAEIRGTMGAGELARAEIREHLGSRALTVANLCRRVGVSRSTLHRLFEADGGAQTFIRNARLDAARLSLLDPENRERISALAERLGFSDAAHLSRLFRARYGETPTACRARAAPAGDAGD